MKRGVMVLSSLLSWLLWLAPVPATLGFRGAALASNARSRRRPSTSSSFRLFCAEPPLPLPQTTCVLSYSLEETAAYLGGTGRAKLAWDCYRNGIDPTVYYAGTSAAAGGETTTTAAEALLLPSCRRNQRLARATLQKLRPVTDVAQLTYQTVAKDRTTKLLLQLQEDGLEIETVIIPWANVRSTLCLSSQVGCRQGCVFCATGKMGRLRNLSPDEIVIQMYYGIQVARSLGLPPIQGVVFMGMGDAADNAEAVQTAVQQLTSRGLFQLAAHKVTVSTVAPTPDVFATFRDANCALAWSVHAVNDELRKRLVPTTRYRMRDLQAAYIANLSRRKIQTTMLEIALIENVNDSLQDAIELADFCGEIQRAVPSAKVMVNLIPFNDIGMTHLGYRTPTYDIVRQFQYTLWKRGIRTHVRATRGGDEAAACGQLVTKKKKNIEMTDLQAERK